MAHFVSVSLQYTRMRLSKSSFSKHAVPARQVNNLIVGINSAHDMYGRLEIILILHIKFQYVNNKHCL